MVNVPTSASPAQVMPSPAISELSLVARLRSIAVRSLARMYQPKEKLFVFRLRRIDGTIVSEGLSRRYTAIALIGLAQEDHNTLSAVLGTDDLATVYGSVLRGIGTASNLGDVALALWAGHALGIADRKHAAARLRSLHPEAGAQPTVELAWVVSALSLDSTVAEDLRDAVARRLLDGFNRRTHAFPHVIGGQRSNRMGTHVLCFADLVYPIQALSFYSQLTRSAEGRETVRACAEYICSLQGAAGQWWWHYDFRTGHVLEPYPVYAVHQDAMAPMALFAAAAATDGNFDQAIRRGLEWLEKSPELSDGTLIDQAADLIWRKVARREPGKLSRYGQALASRVHPSLRLPCTDFFFPAVTIDTEDRPYHLGWLLYAFPPVCERKQ